MGMNPTQQLVPVKPGDPMRADGQNHLVQKFLKMITVGPGLEIKRAAQGIVLLLKPQIIPTGGGGEGGWIQAAAYDLLPFPEAKKIAQIYTGPQKGQIYKLGYDLEGTAFWKCIDETYEATTKAGLTNNEYVQQFAVGRVGSIYYRRNEANNGWEAQNEFE